MQQFDNARIAATGLMTNQFCMRCDHQFHILCISITNSVTHWSTNKTNSQPFVLPVVFLDRKLHEQDISATCPMPQWRQLSLTHPFACSMAVASVYPVLRCSMLATAPL